MREWIRKRLREMEKRRPYLKFSTDSLLGGMSKDAYVSQKVVLLKKSKREYIEE